MFLAHATFLLFFSTSSRLAEGWLEPTCGTMSGRAML